MLATGALSLPSMAHLLHLGQAQFVNYLHYRFFMASNSLQTNWLTTPTNNTLFPVCPEKRKPEGIGKCKIKDSKENVISAI